MDKGFVAAVTATLIIGGLTSWSISTENTQSAKDRMRRASMEKSIRSIEESTRKVDELLRGTEQLTQDLHELSESFEQVKNRVEKNTPALEQ